MFFKIIIIILSVVPCRTTVQQNTKLQTQFFASEICYYVSQSVVRDHRITIYSLFSSILI